MDYEPAEYRKLTLKQFPARALRETAEGKYWKRFSNPVNAQQVRYRNSHLFFKGGYYFARFRHTDEQQHGIFNFS